MMMKTQWKHNIKRQLSSALLTNSVWGIVAGIFQNILYSAFFIIVARKYSTDTFANYIVANALYSFIVSFSSLGLGQWLIRDLMQTADKSTLIHTFFKIQAIAGFLFFLLNVLISYTIFDNPLIRQLSLIIGINIIFDNIIYVIKNLNIAEELQKKTFLILSIEAVLKFLIGIMLLFYVIPIVYVSIILIIIRLVTLNLFLRIGTSFPLNWYNIVFSTIRWNELKRILFENWPFILIGSIAILYWRIGNIVISKFLTPLAVTQYEISFKLFSIAQLIPLMVTGSLYPVLIGLYKEDIQKFSNTCKKWFYLFNVYGLFSYTFVFTYSKSIIPLFFGKSFAATSPFCNEMFLTILVFPTAILQANMLIAMGLEKKDMWINLASFAIHVLFVGIGLQYFTSLSVINYSIFISFLVFHILQDVIFVIKKMLSFYHALVVYLINFILIVFYQYFSNVFESIYFFVSFWLILISMYLGKVIILNYRRKLLMSTDKLQ